MGGTYVAFLGWHPMTPAKNLKKKGFQRIYMASGFDADELDIPKGIVKGCVGKKPPFDETGHILPDAHLDLDDEL